MMRKKLIILCTIGILMITACGKNKDTQQAQTEDNKQTENIKQTETQSDASDTKPEKLSELEQKIEDFKKNTPSEITVMQDVLRGEWRILDRDILEDKSYYPEYIKLGNLDVSYDTSSKNSKVIFTNNEFMASFDKADVGFNGHQNGNELRSAIVVSGLYRVISEPVFEEYQNDAEIEMLITAVSPKYGSNYSRIYDELNALVGTTITKKITFVETYSDWSDLTEEQLADYDVELHDKVTVTSVATFGMTGMIYYDTPQISEENPFTCVYLDTQDDSELFTGCMRTKTKNTLNLDYEDVEPGEYLYDVYDHDKDTETD